MTTAIAVAAATGLLAAATFVAMYWRSDWRSSQVGINLMLLPAVIGGLLCLGLVALVAGPLPGWVWLAGIGALDAALWWRVWILWRLQHQRSA